MPKTSNDMSPLDILLQKIEIDATTKNTKYLIYEYLYGNKSESEEKKEFIREVEPSARGIYFLSKKKEEDKIGNTDAIILRARAGLFRSHVESIDVLLNESIILSVESKEMVSHLTELRELLLFSANTMKKEKQYIGGKEIAEKIKVLQGQAPSPQPKQTARVPMIAPNILNIWQETKETTVNHASTNDDSNEKKQKRFV